LANQNALPGSTTTRPLQHGPLSSLPVISRCTDLSRSRVIPADTQNLNKKWWII